MENVSPEILKAQAEYAARPYAVYIATSHFKGEFRFDTLGEALEYLIDQYERAKRTVARERYRAFDARDSVVTLPGNIEVAAREFLGPSLSSY